RRELERRSRARVRRSRAAIARRARARSGPLPHAVGIALPSPVSTPEPAPVAQLDRAPGFEPGGRGFESLPARQLSSWFRSLPSLLRSAPGGAAVAALSLLGVEARRRHCGFVPPRSSGFFWPTRRARARATGGAKSPQGAVEHCLPCDTRR